jgi:hypothetical protein
LGRPACGPACACALRAAAGKVQAGAVPAWRAWEHDAGVAGRVAGWQGGRVAGWQGGGKRAVVAGRLGLTPREKPAACCVCVAACGLGAKRRCAWYTEDKRRRGACPVGTTLTAAM